MNITKSLYSLLIILLCVVVVSQILVGAAALRFDDAPPPDSSNSTGTISVLVVPVKFRDLENRTSLDAIQTRVFKNLNAYFKEASYGKLTLTGKVLPKWYALSKSMIWYGKGNEQWESLIQDSLNAASRQVDYLDYDYVIIVHAGDDESRSFNSSDIVSFGSTGKFLFTLQDRQYALGVSCLSEFDPIGPYAHFLALNMGLPRMDKGWQQIWEWDLMAHGFWAGNGTMPVQPTSFTKLKARWLSDANLTTVASGKSLEADLGFIDEAGGVKAIKLPIAGKRYLLIEARRKTGFDKYLPAEGVLILYIDESLLQSQKALQVIDVNPSSQHLDDAALQVGEIYSNTTFGFTVAVLSKTSSSFHIKIDRSGSTAPPKLDVETLNNMSVMIDNRTLESPSGVVERSVIVGSHVIQVPEETATSNGTRLVFSGWSDGESSTKRGLNVANDTVLKAHYLKQYQLNVQSIYGTPTGAGWYSEGSTATISVDDKVEHLNGTRHVFTSWSAGEVFNSTKIDLTMNEPKTAVSNWKTEYRLEINSRGLPEGTSVTLNLNGQTKDLQTPFTQTIWLPKGEKVTLQITTSPSAGQSYKLQEINDKSNNKVTSQITLNEPQTLTAVFAPESTTQQAHQNPPAQPAPIIEDMSHKVSSRLFSIAARNRYLLQAFIAVGSPAYWSYLVADVLRASFVSPFVSQLAVSLAFGTLLGLIYLFPLCLLILGLAAWRMHRRTRARGLIAPVVMLIAGLVLAVLGMRFPSPSELVFIAGLALTAFGVSLLIGLGLSVFIIRLGTVRNSRLNWRS